MASTRKENVYGNFSVPFGIKNAAGLMEVENGKVKNPIFSHESYKISTTFDSKHSEDFGYITYKDKPTRFEGTSYQKVFRKSVRWDFGDGTTVDGYTATHSYTRPGKYTITCTFFDIWRQGYVNGYSVQVIVKQVIPTQLAIADYAEANKLDSVKCSAVNTIATIDATLSNLVNNSPDVIVERIFNADEEVRPSWEDVKDLTMPQLRKYYAMLSGEWERDDELSLIEKQPVSAYSPDYYTLYGRFYTEGGQMKLEAYRVEPYLLAIENTPSGETLPISINDPNVSILEVEQEPRIEVPVKLVSSLTELPSSVSLIGRRAIFSVNYKSDFVSEKDILSIHYDLENTNISGSLESATNFLNIPPLGINFPVTPNDFSPNSTEDRHLFFSLSNTGFDFDESGVSKETLFSFVKDFTFKCFLVPVIIPTTQSGVLLSKEYYIPKDYDFYNTDVSVRYYGENDSIITIDRRDDFSHVLDVTFKLGSVLDAEIIVPGFEPIVLKKELVDLSALVIPTEHYYNQSLDDLLAAYLPHKMFDNAANLKQLLKNAFGNNRILDYLVTKGVNFFDDNVNIDTVYIKQLLSILTMMGREVTEYNDTNFDGVNELRDIARILSMNFTRLMGNKIPKPDDIRVTDELKGANIGDRIEVTDILHVYMHNRERELVQGKVFKVERDGTIYNVEVPTILVAADDYTTQTHTVSFAGLEPEEIYEDEDGNQIGKYVISSYLPSWGWNLLLPEKYKPEDTARIIDSYYSFYLYRPSSETVRVGNFLDDATIQEEFDTLQNWFEEQGLPDRVIQKILLAKGNLHSLGQTEFNRSAILAVSDVQKANSAIVFTLDIEEPNTVVDISAYIDKGSDYQISWGDRFKDDNKTSHKYIAPGIYDVTLTGVVHWTDRFVKTDYSLRNTLLEISIPEGKTSALYRTEGGFSRCAKLRKVPANLYENIQLTSAGGSDLRESYACCSALEEIPEGFLDIQASRADLTDFFYDSGIKRIPENLLYVLAKQCKKIRLLHFAMFCDGLTELPKGFLSCMTPEHIVEASYAFANCQGLITTPQYWKTTKGTLVSDAMFADCHNAKSLKFAPKAVKERIS